MKGWHRADWTGWCWRSLSACCHTTFRMASTFDLRSWAVEMVSGCREKEFQCKNGRCVPAGPLGSVCDGVNDCGDGSDEMYCEPCNCKSHIPKLNIEILLTYPRSCPAGQFSCPPPGECVSVSVLCDGRPDCKDHSDEINCGEGSAIFGHAYFLSSFESSHTTNFFYLLYVMSPLPFIADVFLLIRVCVPYFFLFPRTPVLV
uniref:Subcommissural organ spondin n=1 Tax=Sander lucioperca TaxID=283035 RepID=A0A8C9YBW8_SANLU